MTLKFIVLLCLAVLGKGIDISSLKLEQVLILSRHNVRTPLTDGLEKYSSKPWPKWNNSVGELTKKGAELESYMGKYIAEWLDTEEFIEWCPDKEDVLIYANTRQRTIATAKAFAESAFFLCNITVKHEKNLNAMDPIFFPILHNNSETHRNYVKQEMVNKLKALNITEAYLELNRILILETADICKKLFMCDLTSLQNDAVLDHGDEPNVSGPLFMGNAIVDSFIMSYYEGMPLKEIGWGEITSDEQWELLSKISSANQDIRFNLKTGSKDLAGPLLKFMFDIFKSGTPKFTALFGHDSNLNSVISALGFKPFKLVNQFEPYPIGGKIIFQKWKDTANTYLKVEYVYPNSKQLRYAARLSMSHPPQRVLLELNDCKMSANGYCLWQDFMKLNTYS